MVLNTFLEIFLDFLRKKSWTIQLKIEMWKFKPGRDKNIYLPTRAVFSVGNWDSALDYY